MKPLHKRYSQNRRCPSCTTRITNTNSLGMCKRCWLRVKNADPEFRRRVSEGLKRKLKQDPAAYAKKCAVLADNRAKARAHPDWAEKQARSFAALLEAAKSPEVEARRIAGLIAANKRRRHAWLPDELRGDYRKMVQHSRIPAVEAKRIILEQIEAERRRAKAQLESLSPFEKQERALRNGAQLVANDLKPSLDRPGIYEERKAG